MLISAVGQYFDSMCLVKEWLRLYTFDLIQNAIIWDYGLPVDRGLYNLFDATTFRFDLQLFRNLTRGP